MAGTSGTVQSAALVPPAACNSSLGASPLHAMWRRWGGGGVFFIFYFLCLSICWVGRWVRRRGWYGEGWGDREWSLGYGVGGKEGGKLWGMG